MIIVDPTSHKTIEVENPKSSSNTTSQAATTTTTTTTTKDDNQSNELKATSSTPDEPQKTQIRATFQKQVALLLAQPGQSEKVDFFPTKENDVIQIHYMFTFFLRT